MILLCRVFCSVPQLCEGAPTWLRMLFTDVMATVTKDFAMKMVQLDLSLAVHAYSETFDLRCHPLIISVHDDLTPEDVSSLHSLYLRTGVYDSCV